MLSVGRTKGCIDGSRTNELMGSDNCIGIGIKLNDSDIIGNSSLAMASALAFGQFTANGDILGSVATTFKAVGSLESTSTANLGTGKDMAVLWGKCKVVDTIELC